MVARELVGEGSEDGSSASAKLISVDLVPGTPSCFPLLAPPSP